MVGGVSGFHDAEYSADVATTGKLEGQSGGGSGCLPASRGRQAPAAMEAQKL
jgi:hypothetical protein